MKQVISGLAVLAIFLTHAVSAQNTLRFDGEGHADNGNLGHPYQITKNSKTFNFSNSDGDDILYESSGGFCTNGYPNSLLVGAYGSATVWTIEIDDGSEIDLAAIDFSNQYTTCFPFTYNLKVEGFKNNVSTGTAIPLAVGTANHITTFTANSNFDEVDKIVITATSSVLGAMGIEEIRWSAAAANPVVTLSVSNNNPSEGAGSVTITATADVAPTSDLTVNLSYSGTASGSGTDFTEVSSIVISSGTTSNTGTLNITSDSDIESDETVVIDISSLTGVTATEGSPNQQTVTITNDDYAFSIKVFLEGPLSGTTMSTSLNSSLPANPSTIYSSALSETSGGIPVTAVDWVEVELRTGTAAGTKVGTNRAAILKNDGTLLDKDGNAFTMSQADGTSYYIVIHHRNHLSVMSNAVVAHSSGTYTFDFTGSQANSYNGGANGAIQVGSVFAMYAGDANGDGTVNATDLTTWRAQNGAAFSYGSNDKTDLNMDGVINAVDRNEYQQKNSTTSTQVPSS